ncbi:LysE family translocator [Glycomyces buryatensis]|uniref:LysE family translocator n=1 Tax=Glycomyces buryatensis TaxID=2570927 RepID=A0A4S8QJ70_9ACTN|nr:LysE family translocator [Glycomyces buryatensis]THV43055.1 LysE family translocator [Glycomyces buryatensis]
MTMFLVFGGAVLLACIAPGPDFAMMVRNTMLGGRATGMWTAIGIALGVSVWIVATSVGLAALLAASAVAFTVVKIAGAAYLVYLGVRSIRGALKDRHKAVEEILPDQGMSRWAAFRSGLLCNVLNPKAAVFFTALMPQFLGGHWTHIGELAILGTVITGLWFLLLANLIGLARRYLNRPKVRAWINGATGAVMVALGLRVAST